MPPHHSTFSDESSVASPNKKPTVVALPIKKPSSSHPWRPELSKHLENHIVVAVINDNHPLPELRGECLYLDLNGSPKLSVKHDIGLAEEHPDWSWKDRKESDDKYITWFEECGLPPPWECPALYEEKTAGVPNNNAQLFELPNWRVRNAQEKQRIRNIFAVAELLKSGTWFKPLKKSRKKFDKNVKPSEANAKYAVSKWYKTVPTEKEWKRFWRRWAFETTWHEALPQTLVARSDAVKAHLAKVGEKEPKHKHRGRVKEESDSD
ncbi:hypothetical protein BT63DRAFT_456336 [Microthyrium microscopicum]|uniref:Uncharacterized protein n=1 Tax=Microthyrium microscopicum TaxID=703497 RepID=A0A6A6UAR9_9PEZI|nr:hypothetical protein BT63DRAFT_456336 [Microthyrium microscopicum]